MILTGKRRLWLALPVALAAFAWGAVGAWLAVLGPGLFLRALAGGAGGAA